MSSLIASKIAAIFLRKNRGIGRVIYNEKGRDIYDLLWYMGKKIIPDLDYLVAKGVDVKNMKMLFDKLTLQMNKVSNDNLKNDLLPLFTDQTFIKNWLENWFESYLKLLDNYEIRTITKLESIKIFQDFLNDNFSFRYKYDTEENKSVQIVYNLSDYWIHFKGGDLIITPDKKIIGMIEFHKNAITNKSIPKDKLNQYATFFY